VLQRQLLFRAAARALDGPAARLWRDGERAFAPPARHLVRGERRRRSGGRRVHGRAVGSRHEDRGRSIQRPAGKAAELGQRTGLGLDKIRAFSRHRTIATLMIYVDEHDRAQTQKTLGDLVASTLAP